MREGRLSAGPWAAAAGSYVLCNAGALCNGRRADKALHAVLVVGTDALKGVPLGAAVLWRE